MVELYNKTTFECSKLITKNYSTSFTLGIQTLNKRFHLPIYAIYGFVRYADEIVDTFHDHDKRKLLEEFKQDTFKAIDEKLSFNPVLHSFQMVVNEYNIDHNLIYAFLHSMEMDLDNSSYNESKYHEYIYGSAEVVGLMCLKVFLEGDDEKYNELEGYAKHLGSAFQKVNFLRDIKSDYQDRGRIYFPNADFNAFTLQTKEYIENDIQYDFEQALIGIKKLPTDVQMGVYMAYIYYTKLFNKIRHTSPEAILSKRIRVPDLQKMLLLLSTVLKYRILRIV